MTKSSLRHKPRLLDVGRGPGHDARHGPKNRASRQNNLAPLICRVVRAVRVRGRWAWIPGWGLPLRSRLSPPTSDISLDVWQKSLKFIKCYWHFEIWHQVKTPKSLKFQWFYSHVHPWPFHALSVASRKPDKTLGVINILIHGLSITFPSPQENIVKP